MKTKRFSVWSLAVVCLLCVLCADAAYATVFGFNYWPQDYSCDILNDANWTAANKAVVEQDLNLMASLGTGCIRLMLWPERSGFMMGTLSGSGGYFTSDFTEQTSNLPELVQMCKDRDMEVVICFGNSYLGWGDGTPGHRWWMDVWPSFNDFLADSLTWVNGFVDSVEASSCADAVIYYDYQNEYYRYHPNSAWYVQVLYDWSSVPAGKRGCSVLQVPDDAADLAYQLGATRPLEYVEYHSYPAYPANANIEQCYDQVLSYFPNSTVLLGEYGRETTTSTEDEQQTTVLDVTQRAFTKGIPYALHWTLWDRTITPTMDYGLAWEYDSPKDVLGGLADYLTPLYNPDGEMVTGGVPDGWGPGSSSGSHSIVSGYGDPDSASNDRYVRLQVNSATGNGWLYTALVPVNGESKAYVNAYIRSNMSNVQIVVYEYDQNYTVIGSQAGPGFYNTWSWELLSYQHIVGPWDVSLDPATRYVALVFVGNCVSNPSYLDVDCVTLDLR